MTLILSSVLLLFIETVLLYFWNQKAPNVIQSLTIPGKEPKPTEPWERLEISHACL